MLITVILKILQLTKKLMVFKRESITQPRPNLRQLPKRMTRYEGSLLDTTRIINNIEHQPEVPKTYEEALRSEYSKQ